MINFSLNRPPPRRRLSRALAMAVSATLIALGLVVLTTAPASAAPPPEPSKSHIAMTFAGHSGKTTNLMGPDLCPDPEECGGGGGGGCPPFCLPPPGCNASLASQSATRGDNPEFGGPYSRVNFGSSISCFGGPQASFIQAQLWDRTSGFDGYVHALAPPQYNVTNATSSGSIDLYDADYYPAAQWVEQVLVLDLVGPLGWLWGPCNPPPQWRLLWCDGVGTPFLSAGAGFFPFATGVSALPFGCGVTPQIVNYRSSPGGAIIVGGTGFVSCDQKADISIRVKLFRRDYYAGGAWVQMSESNLVTYPDVPRGTTKVNQSQSSCNEEQPDGLWRVEVYGKGVYHGFFGDTVSEKTVGSNTPGFVEC
jgi:hypothetical protein